VKIRKHLTIPYLGVTIRNKINFIFRCNNSN